LRVSKAELFSQRRNREEASVGRDGSRLVRKAQVAGLLLAAGAAVAACSSNVSSGTRPSSSQPGNTAKVTTTTVKSSGGGSTTSTSTSTSTPTSTPTTPTTVVTESQPEPPAGGPVPAGFEPGSVSFVSPYTGFVLGSASCGTGRCTAVLRTENTGSTWVSLSSVPAVYDAPETLPPSSGAQVTELAFADSLDGWAYGPSLFATHDGGQTWEQLDLGGVVVSLETMGGYVDAVVSPCAFETSCTGSVRLEQAPVGSNDFTTVLAGPSTAVSVAEDVNELSLHAPVGFVALGRSGYQGGRAFLYGTGNLSNPNGWNAFPDPCAATGLALDSFIAPNTTELYSLCTGDPAMGSTSKKVVLTDDGNSTVVGVPPLGGDGGMITANANGVVLIGSYSAATFIYRSADGGSTWSTPEFFGDGGSGYKDLGFTTAAQGVYIHILPEPGSGATLYITQDAGETWQAVRFG
jgi:hypothetical protein